MNDLDDAERIRRRYPRPRYVRTVVVAVSVIAVAAGLSWLLWAAGTAANPPVSGQIESFTVTSDTTVSVTLIVERTDPSQAAVCDLVVQSESFERVGELAVTIAPSDQPRERVEVTVKTFKRGTAASLSGCLIQ